MKTNQVMKRQMGVFAVYQRTSDGFFDAGDLLRQWNSTLGTTRKQMSKFLELENTSEFMKALALDESQRAKTLIAENQLVISIKGRNTKHGRTPDKVWMNPILFIKFAMWLNPTFEVQVIRFVYDSMLKYRNESAEAYKKLANSVSLLVGKDKVRSYMPNMARALNHIVFGEHITMARNEYGDESKQRELWNLEIKLAELVEDGFIKSYDHLISYLRKIWNKKYQPKVLR